MDHEQTPNRNVQIMFTLVIIGMVAAFIAFWSWPRKSPTDPDLGKQLSPSATRDFYVSLAALDVEENERAAKVLQSATAAEPSEPTLWANLSLALMRTQQVEEAEAALNRALEISPDDPSLLEMQATLWEFKGSYEQAIESLRKVVKQQPDNHRAAYSLALFLGQMQDEKLADERIQLLQSILKAHPRNLRTRIELSRTLAASEDFEELAKELEFLRSDEFDWDDRAAGLLSNAVESLEQNDVRNTLVNLAYFENLIKPQTVYQVGLPEVGISASSIGSPIRKTITFKIPPVKSAPADMALEFKLETATSADLVVAIPRDEKHSSTLLTLFENVLSVPESAELPVPGATNLASRNSICLADINDDFLLDIIIVGEEGLSFFVASEANGFSKQEVEYSLSNSDLRSVWVFDREADGDLDLIITDANGKTITLQNNGVTPDSKTIRFEVVETFKETSDVIQCHRVDFDQDGDIDIVFLYKDGTLSVFRNDRSGTFVRTDAPNWKNATAICIGDVNQDNVFDLIALLDTGEIRYSFKQEDGTWNNESLFSISDEAASSLSNIADAAFAPRLFLSDLDNNGDVDLVVGLEGFTELWIHDSDEDWQVLPSPLNFTVHQVIDLNEDGKLDLLGIQDGKVVKAINQSSAGYLYQVIYPTANPSGGDRRINSHAIGGAIEVRAGDQSQLNLIDSPIVHVGLGNQEKVDLIRIVWPNGTIQAEFDSESGQTIAARQRLSTSCPWVFSYNGEEFVCSKDFIWRSPLGMRINAQDTAGVTQTEDWIRLPVHSVQPIDGKYPIRITAELWETHFFDHVRLLAIDYPNNATMRIDERFVPNAQQSHQPQFMSEPIPLQNAVGSDGKPVDSAVRKIDGLYAQPFELGKFQGITDEHWISFYLPSSIKADLSKQTASSVYLTGNGWIYPTDSSLNVALAQAGIRPQGLELERQNEQGDWIPVAQNLGFPAGKNKDMVVEIPMAHVQFDQPYRLKTNMEISWDTLACAVPISGMKFNQVEATTQRAELRYRGFSVTNAADRFAPEIPLYRLQSTTPRWLDPTGYATRWGDVSELLNGIDDRYVIMTAGDELVFEFEFTSEPPPGWKREFILIGDGWVKDGNFNTAFSDTIRPLPLHSDAAYAGPLMPLEDDPGYQKHPEDWQHYHTRYVRPRVDTFRSRFDLFQQQSFSKANSLVPESNRK